MNISQEIYDGLNSHREAQKLWAFLDNAEDEELFHVDVYDLAEKWGASRQEVLELFLYGVNEGLFSLQWEYHCPSCGAVTREALGLHQAETTDHCPICVLDFSNSLDETIEVFFTISPQVHPLPDLYREGYEAAIKEAVQNQTHYPWRTDTTIMGLDCLQNGVFRRLFGDETLPTDQSLEIGNTTILFTDIKGSTQMYELLGDPKAFHLVSKHFSIVFDEIEQRGGVAVKTIGDAVMGVFIHSRDAVSAAFAMQRKLDDFGRGLPQGERIELKIGIHSGPVIAVTLNGRLDYFGRTVNAAARIQGKAKPREVVFSQKVFASSRKTLSAFVRHLKKTTLPLRGIEGSFELFRADLSPLE